MTELNQFASIYERKSVDNSNTSNSSVANPLSDSNVDVIIELFADNSSGVTKKENLVKSYFGNNADTAIEIFSNKSSDSSSSSEEVSLKSYFGADTTALTAKQKRIMSYSPYDLVKYSKEEIDEVVSTMRAQAKKEGIDFDKLPTEEKMRFTGLALALKTGRITGAEFLSLVSDSLSDDVKAKIQDYIKDHTSEIDEEKLGKIRSVMSSAARKEAFLNFVAAKNIRGRNPEDTKTRQERFLLMAAERTEETQQKLMEKVASALPSTCTEDVARKVIESTSHYSQEKMSSMLRLSKSFNGSDSFQKALADMATTVAKKAKNLTTLFLDGFFETTKGKAIKDYVKNAYYSLIQEKKEYFEQKEENKKLTEKMKEAEKISKAAMEEAEYRQKQAESFLSQKGLKNLSEVTPDKMAKLLNMHGMYSQQVEYEFAQGKMKKAKEAAEDAASAKRLADAFLEIDLKSLQFAAQRFMLKMAALSKVVLR